MQYSVFFVILVGTETFKKTRPALLLREIKIFVRVATLL